MKADNTMAARTTVTMLALALVMGLAGLALDTVQAQALSLGSTFKVGGNTYQVVDIDDGNNPDDVMLVKYGSASKTPSINTVKYKGQVYEVESIGKNAFNNAKGHKITSVTLGRNVESIGAKAFYGCKKLKTIDLSKCDAIDLEFEHGAWKVDDLDIGKNAFAGAGVSKVKVKCGSAKAGYQKVFKKALCKKGLRSDAKLAK